MKRVAVDVDGILCDLNAAIDGFVVDRFGQDASENIRQYHFWRDLGLDDRQGVYLIDDLYNPPITLMRNLSKERSRVAYLSEQYMQLNFHSSSSWEKKQKEGEP